MEDKAEVVTEAGLFGRHQALEFFKPVEDDIDLVWHRGELFPRVGFIVTNMSAQAQGVVFHSRMVTVQVAEVAVSKEMWAEVLSRIDRLRWITA